MPTARAPGRSVRARRRRARDLQRAKRTAVVTALGVVVLVTLLLTAFGSTASPVQPAPAPAQAPPPAGPPRPEVIALYGTLRVQLPIQQGRVTAIGYHASDDSALALTPVGTQANQSFLTRLFHRVFGGDSGGLRWYQLSGGEGPSTGALDVGATPGTDVYAPADGTVVGIVPSVIDGRRYGARIDIEPASAPSLVISVTHVRADPALTVGASVGAGTSKIGTVLDYSSVERQALSQFTQGAGNHVSVEVHPAATLTLG